MLLATSKNNGSLSLVLLQRTQGAQRQKLPIYISTLTNFNVAVFCVANTLVIYRFFGYVNGVYSNKKLRQSVLVLEKFWVTHVGWLRLYMTVVMGMTITNFWKLSSCGGKRYHYYKLIGIR